jgi:hypothetical protein
MDQILTEPYMIPRRPYEREMSCLDPGTVQAGPSGPTTDLAAVEGHLPADQGSRRRRRRPRHQNQSQSDTV